MRRPVGQVGNPQGVEGGGDPSPDLFPVEPEVDRAEGHVLGDGGGEQLVVGFLEDELDPPPQLQQRLPRP